MYQHSGALSCNIPSYFAPHTPTWLVFQRTHAMGIITLSMHNRAFVPSSMAYLTDRLRQLTYPGRTDWTHKSILCGVCLASILGLVQTRTRSTGAVPSSSKFAITTSNTGSHRTRSLDAFARPIDHLISDTLSMEFSITCFFGPSRKMWKINFTKKK